MLGWHIGVFRLEGDRESPGTADSPLGARLAEWQTGIEGLGWIRDLVRHERAAGLGGNGYPLRFTARARDLIGPILDGPPEANLVWLFETGDVLLPGWAGKTVINRAAIDECSPAEWLLVEAWDAS